ncbi:MAG: hypothetical protein IVW55_13270 [Chloroflexi bacterium]|nr:hypothetical protein [Chloroflexota bacterium]
MSDTTLPIHNQSADALAQAAVATPRFLRHRAEPAAVTLFFTLLTVIMTWPWTANLALAQYPVVGDIALQMTVMRWNAHAFFTNPPGLFEAPFFYPYAHSLAYSEPLIGQTIIALPALLLTNNPALAYNINVLLSFILTGLFTYLLVRDLTGSRPAALLAAVAFAFCPYRFMQISHQHLLATQWFPFTLWAFNRWLGISKSPQTSDKAPTPPTHQFMIHNSKLTISSPWLALATAGFIAMGLSSVYYTYFLALTIALYFLWWITFGLTAQERRAIRWLPLLTRLGIAALIAAIFLLPVLIPYAQANSDLGLSRTIYEVQNWSAEWGWYTNVTADNWLYGYVLAPSMVTTSGERQLFFGIIPFLLALAGLVRGRGRARFFYLALGIFAFAMTFGLSRNLPGTSFEVPLPYALFYNWLPGFKALRVPIRFSVLVDFSIYVLAGYGLARLLAWRPTRQPTLSSRPLAGTITRTLATILLIAIVLIEFANPLDASRHKDITAQLAAAEPYAWLAKAENSGPLIELPMTADQPDVLYMLYNTRDWQPLVNGWSGFVPPGTVRLKQALDTFPDPFTITLLQGLELRHVVVHLSMFPPDTQPTLKKQLDATKELSLAYQSGEDYVYTLAPNPWLRQIASTVGSNTLWVGEARYNTMPSLDILAYALRLWGVNRTKMAGNIQIGYQPAGTLPFGAPADYALVPNLPDAARLPFGYEDMQQISSNPAVRLLQKPTALLATYDFNQPNAPKLDPTNTRLQISPSSLSFDSQPPTSNPQLPTTGPRYADMRFAAFSPTDLTLRTGSQATTLHLPEGVSRYVTPPITGTEQLTISPAPGAAAQQTTMLSASLWSALPAGTTPAQLSSAPDLMLLQTSSQPASTPLDNLQSTIRSSLRVVAPRAPGDYTITLDAYVEPWGTHPTGHFGSWSVVLPADAAAHTYTFALNPITKEVTTTRDNAPLQTFSWTGHPTEGDFSVTLSIRQKDGSLIATVPLYLFTRQSNRLTAYQPNPLALLVVPPEGK